MSDVDMQPSESTRSNVVGVAARSAASAVCGVDDGVGGEDARASSPGPARACRRPWPSRRRSTRRSPSTCTCAVLGTVSVVMIATAASGPPSGDRASAAASTPASSVSHGQPLADEPVEQTTTSPAETSEHVADVLGGAVRVGEALGPGAHVGAARVEDDGARRRRRRPPGATTTTGAPTTRFVREDGGGDVRRSVVDDEGEVGPAGGLQPGGDPGGAEAGGAVTVTVRLRPVGGRASRAGRARGSSTARRRPRCP